MIVTDGKYEVWLVNQDGERVNQVTDPISFCSACGFIRGWLVGREVEYQSLIPMAFAVREVANDWDEDDSIQAPSPLADINQVNGELSEAAAEPEIDLVEAAKQ